MKFARNYNKISFRPEKHRYELADKVKKQPSKILIDEKLAIRVTIDCRTTSEHKCGTRLVCKQYNILLTKKQLLLTRKLI